MNDGSDTRDTMKEADEHYFESMSIQNDPAKTEQLILEKLVDVETLLKIQQVTLNEFMSSMTQLSSSVTTALETISFSLSQTNKDIKKIPIKKENDISVIKIADDVYNNRFDKDITKKIEEAFAEKLNFSEKIIIEKILYNKNILEKILYNIISKENKKEEKDYSEEILSVKDAILASNKALSDIICEKSKEYDNKFELLDKSILEYNLYNRNILEKILENNKLLEKTFLDFVSYLGKG